MVNQNNDELVQEVVKLAPTYLDGTSLSDKVIDAMRLVDRGLFIPLRGARETFAYGNHAANIGHEQVASWPSMVAYMVERLELGPEQDVLEVGTGCGYSAAVTALLIPGGTLYTLERISELAEMSRRNIMKWLSALHAFGVLNSNPAMEEVATGCNIDFMVGDVLTHIRLRQTSGVAGYLEAAPYDRISVVASGKIPFDDDPFLAQLKDPGLLMYPTHEDPKFPSGPLFLVNYEGGRAERVNCGDVSFVPLVE